MTTIIASIKPHHLFDIRKGIKIWEVHKNIPKCELPFKVLCCDSGTNGEIKAEFICFRYIAFVGNISGLNSKFLDECCLSPKEFNEFKNNNVLYLWRIDEMIDYEANNDKKRNIRDYGLDLAPITWCYVKDEYIDNE